MMGLSAWYQTRVTCDYLFTGHPDPAPVNELTFRDPSSTGKQIPGSIYNTPQIKQ